MKKFLALALAVGALAVSLSSCKFSEPVTDETTKAEETLPKVDYDAIKDEDESGAFILKSSEDRPVYPFKEGYAVFKFVKGSAYKIYYVREFESEEEANAFAGENAPAMMSSGEYTNFEVNKNLVICSVDIDHKSLGKYYTMNQKDVLKDFEGVETK